MPGMQRPEKELGLMGGIYECERCEAMRHSHESPPSAVPGLVGLICEDCTNEIEAQDDRIEAQNRDDLRRVVDAEEATR